MSNSLVILFLMLFLCLALGAFAVEVHKVEPVYLLVDGSQAFVYPDGDGFVLATEKGDFAVTGTMVKDGCYELVPALLFEERGRAVWKGDACAGGK